ncbi:MAG: L-seryl-tRNA(Sec) selenium transferase, partial [Phycisphaerae bacterium]
MGRKKNALADIPSMTALLDAAARDARCADHPRALVTDALRSSINELRERLRADPSGNGATTVAAMLDDAVRRLERHDRLRLDRVINATGIVLHTGLGRAPLGRTVVDAIAKAAGYCNLEFDLERGTRGRRTAHVEDLLCRLTGAQAALVVNNNAAALLLTLTALATEREVVISRGQLIEIGGSFRLPDVMACSGCVMREVGTTNKTRIGDYERVISERTALLLRVHPSNYRIAGFAESPDIGALATLAHNADIMVYDDLGSGALADVPLWRQADEPTVAASLAAGADVVSFSGDKLLGGPQAGIILGHTEVVERLRKHPMARAMRIGKLTIAALQAVLALYLDPDRAIKEIPALRMLNESMETLSRRAGRLRRALLAALPNEAVDTARTEA